MKNRNLKILSAFLSFILVFLPLFNSDFKVKAEGFTFQPLTQAYIDNLDGVLTMQNDIVYKLAEDILISKDLRISTANGFGFLELNGYKITVGANANVRLTNGVFVNSKDSPVRDDSSAAFKVNGLLLLFYATIDLPYSNAIETGQGGRAVVFNSVIKANSVGISVDEGDCEIYGYSTVDIKNSKNGTGIKIGQNGRAAIISCGSINASIPFDKTPGGKLYDFRNMVSSNVMPGGIVPDTIVRFSYNDTQAQDAAGAIIKFTLDGSEPTEATVTGLSPAKKTAAVVIETDLTIRFIAFIDGQTYELDTLNYYIGVTSQQEFMNKFNSIKDEGGTIYLAGNINFTGQNELNADGQVKVVTNGYRLCADGEGNTLTIGSGMNIEGDGLNGEDTNYGVIAALNGGQLIVNPLSVIRANLSRGTAIQAFEGGSVVVNGGNIYAQKQAVVVNDNNKGANTFASILGGTIEVSEWEGIAVFSLGGANVSIEGNTVINAYGANSIGAYAFGFGSMVIKGDTIINSNADDGIAAKSSNGGKLQIEENAAINSNGLSGRGVLVEAGGGLNVNGGTINASAVYGIGIMADGENEYTKAVMTAGTINTSGSSCMGAYSKAKAEINIKGSTQVNVSGTDSTGIEAFGEGVVFVGDTALINVTGDNSLGVTSSFGAAIDISGNTVVNSMGDMGSGVVVGTGGTINMTSGSVNAKTFGLNVYTEDKDAKSLLNVSSPVVVNVDLNYTNSLGVIVRGEGATCKLGDLVIDAPKAETVYIKTPVEDLNIEKYIPYASGNINIDWYLGNYNGDAPGEYELSGFVNLPQNKNINQVVYLSKYITVKYHEEDFNLDGNLDVKDLALMSRNYNYTTSNPDWKGEFDLNNDGTIDIYDLVKISKLF